MGKINLKSKRQYVQVLGRDAYLTRSMTYSKIDSDQLLERAADNSGVSKGLIYTAMDAVMREFRNFLLNGHSVQLPELGTFRFSIRCKAVDSAELVDANNVNGRHILFKASPALTALVKAVNLSTDVDDADADGSDDDGGSSSSDATDDTGTDDNA